ncbi:MAG: hypothetical protein ACI3YG_07185 [Prevotella sp.]
MELKDKSSLSFEQAVVAIRMEIDKNILTKRLIIEPRNYGIYWESYSKRTIIYFAKLYILFLIEKYQND